MQIQTFLSTAKQGDYALGSVRPSALKLTVCAKISQLAARHIPVGMTPTQASRDLYA